MDTEQIISINPDMFNDKKPINYIYETKSFNWRRKSYFSSYIRSMKFRESRNVTNTIEFLERLCFETTLASIIYHLEYTDISKIQFIEQHLFEPWTDEIRTQLREFDIARPEVIINNNSIEFIINEEERL